MSLDSFDPKSDETVGYHIFLEPEGALKSELETIMAKLADEYGGPQFMPHVTLLSRIPSESDEEVLMTAIEFTKTLTSFSLTLDTLSSDDAYFRALYIRIAEIQHITKLHQSAAEAFSMESSGEFVPHLSVLYGNYPTVRIQESMRTLAYSYGKSFLVNSLHMYRTHGTVREWEKIGEVSF